MDIYWFVPNYNISRVSAWQPILTRITRVNDRNRQSWKIECPKVGTWPSGQRVGPLPSFHIRPKQTDRSEFLKIYVFPGFQQSLQATSMLETECVDDKFDILMTDLPTSKCHQYHRQFLSPTTMWSIKIKAQTVHHEPVQRKNNLDRRRLIFWDLNLFWLEPNLLWLKAKVQFYEIRLYLTSRIITKSSTRVTQDYYHGKMW